MKKWRFQFFSRLIKSRRSQHLVRITSEHISSRGRGRTRPKWLDDVNRQDLKKMWKKNSFVYTIRFSPPRTVFFIPSKHCDVMSCLKSYAPSRTPCVLKLFSAFLISLTIPACLSVEDSGRLKACMATVETVLENNSPELLVIPNEDELSIFISNRVHVKVT